MPDIKDLIDLGSTAVIAVLLLYLGFKFMTATQELASRMQEMTLGIIKADMESRERHTAALAELTSFLRNLNGRLVSAVKDAVSEAERHG
ncbi:MAG: hypothetical protein M1343_02980 [Chloroflexi bacterium]|nr:hypothetical protein [Chloroflexota bacterium]